MKYSILVTDKNDRMVFDKDINQRKNGLINQMTREKKTMMIIHGLFLNLVEIEDVSSEKS